MMRYTWRFLFIPAMAMLVTLWIFSYYTKEVLPEVKEQEKQEYGAAIGGDYRLTNQNGQTVTNSDFEGLHTLVYFGFTFCPDICPTDLADISGALDMLTPQELEKIQPIFITIDPERDTVEKLKTYFEGFHPKFQALTGTKQDILDVIKKYKVFSQKATSDTMGDYLMNHSAYTYLMSPDGQYITHFNHGQGSEAIAAGVKKYLSQ